MKRNFIIRNVILGIIILAIIIFGGIYLNRKIGLNYKIEEVKEHNYFLLKTNEKTGVIDREGNIVVEPKFDNIIIPNPEKDMFVCYENNITKVLNKNQEEKLGKYNNVEPIRLSNLIQDLIYEKTVFKYLENGKYGLINFRGRKITKPIYDEITGLQYKEGELLVKVGNKYGVINIKGNEILKTEYDNIVIDEYYEKENKYRNAGYIVSNRTDDGYRYGYYDKEGKKILNIEYNDIERVADIEGDKNIYLIVAKNGQYGIAKNGKIITNTEYQNIKFNAKHKVFIIKKGEKEGMANLEGKVLLEPNNDFIDTTGIYLYSVNGEEIKVYNDNGTEANFDTNIAILRIDSEDFKIRVRRDENSNVKYGLVTDEMEKLIDEKYEYLGYLYGDFFVASSDGKKFGVINEKEEIILPLENEVIQKIGDTNMIKVKKLGVDNVEIYSSELKKICDMKNINIEENEGYIKVYNDEETKYFDLDGNEKSNKEIYTSNKLFSIKQNGKYGFCDKSGKIVVDTKYDKVTEFNEFGFAGVYKDGKWGSINSEGKEISGNKYTLKETNPEFLGPYYKVIYGFGEYYFTDKIEKNKN